MARRYAAETVRTQDGWTEPKEVGPLDVAGKTYGAMVHCPDDLIRHESELTGFSVLIVDMSESASPYMGRR